MDSKRKRAIALVTLLGVVGGAALVSGRRLRAEASSTERLATTDAPAVVQAANAADVAHDTPASPPAAPVVEDAPVVVVPQPLVTPVTTDMVEAMRAIAARDADLDPHVFAKMGGS